MTEPQHTRETAFGTIPKGTGDKLFNQKYGVKPVRLKCACGNDKLYIEFMDYSSSGNYVRIECPDCKVTEVVYDSSVSRL